ncbi:MAG: lipopolysaccharide heptosyltransferase II [Alysiella sp.]|uniref:lipopolysaccharide heptosyltransferase II n=1 Tax=Alysiella sp. TaxID=1872483 RepID=UPI0026DAAF4D|nr:lipopolysaccharide heptosyltransferase II [Alysiella sp.]MDO4434696.1 lipopolysaccharide heptosyltransferase II [Alysiella sp.]
MSKKILIISPSWVGDCVMSQPLSRRLHELHPNCEIDVFAPKSTMAVFERMSEVRRIIENPFGHGALQLKKRWQIGRELGKHDYDQVIVLPNSLKSAIVPAATGIKQRTGYVGEMRHFLLNDCRRLDKQKHHLMVDRYTALAHDNDADFTSSSYPHLQAHPEQQNAALNKYGLNRQHKIMALSAGAEFGTSKRWLPEHYAAVAQHYLAQNWQIWLFGSPKDTKISEYINNLTQNRCINLAGKTSLGEAIDLLACADGMVCNDSGLMHIAAAFGIKTVAVYGSTDPTHTPPLHENARFTSLNLPCSPCFKRECPLTHHNCMTQLLPERVIELHHQLGN